MSTASLHDVWGKKDQDSEIQVRIDKKIVVRFPYGDSSERRGQLANATAYVKEAIKKGSKLKLKAGVEEHTK